MKTIVHALIIKDRKVLMLNKHNLKIFPGGELRAGESVIECLCREIARDLPEAKLANIRHYRDFFIGLPSNKSTVLSKLYFADIEGVPQRTNDSVSEWYERPKFYTSRMYDAFCPETQEIIELLTRTNYL